VRVAKLPSADLARRIRRGLKPCGNCDICDGKWALFNGAVAAQKLMSAIHARRDVFLGPSRQSPRGGRPKRSGGTATIFCRHLALARNSNRPNGVAFFTAYAADLIVQDQEDRDRWILTGAGRAVLKGEAPLTLRGEILYQRAQGRRPSHFGEIAVAAEDLVPPSEAFTPVKPGGETAPLTANQNRLLAASSQASRSRARAKTTGLIIFHDKVLIEMARRRPKTNEDMRAIPGIGADKMAVMCHLPQSHRQLRR